MTTPVTVINGDSIVGFDVRKLDRALALNLRQGGVDAGVTSRNFHHPVFSCSDRARDRSVISRTCRLESPRCHRA
jgi:hypothetical protein